MRLAQRSEKRRGHDFHDPRHIKNDINSPGEIRAGGAAI
ncbi:hypothetical protein CEV34_2765 [Brucella pseudogrignonensis]|uniref:Uncharacterized protein n=1 Tax=Brucella pseudogrignonensis TaxID=419475 RepID=A0A256GDV3_9HYPH|nr:hypothetical protein CEV34_2765 [Brucella pseudogrignonensis]